VAKAFESPWLAIETATPRASAALFEGETLVREIELNEGRPLAEQLMLGLDHLLKEAGLEVQQLHSMAVSIGPGSFTGLRVGLATLKGLVFGSDVRVAAVPTLAALASSGWQNASEGIAPAERGGEAPWVVSVLDAGRGEVYAAAYATQGSWTALEALPESVYTPTELIERLPPQAVLVGSCLELLERASAEHGGSTQTTWVRTWLRAVPSARDVGRLGFAMLRAGLVHTAEDLLPRYVRRADAEARRTGVRVETHG